MIEWNEQHLMIRDMVRRFVDAEVIPNLEQLGDGRCLAHHQGTPARYGVGDP